jgi:hypothetical protein
MATHISAGAHPEGLLSRQVWGNDSRLIYQDELGYDLPSVANSGLEQYNSALTLFQTAGTIDPQRAARETVL